MKRIVCLLVALILLASVFGITAAADGATTVYDPASYDTEEGRNVQKIMLLSAVVIAATVVGVVIYVNYRQSK